MKGIKMIQEEQVSFMQNILTFEGWYRNATEKSITDSAS